MPGLLTINKKALSNIVSTTLLILLSVITVSLVWYFVINTIKPALSPQNSCFDETIKSIIKIESACLNSSSENIEILLSRSFDNVPLNNLNFIINNVQSSHSWTCSPSCGSCPLIEKGETKKYYFDSLNLENSTVFIQSNNCLLASKEINQLC
jgi:hypothetical protein